MEETVKVYQPKRSKIHYEMEEGLWDEEVKKTKKQKSPKKPVAPKCSNAKSKWNSRLNSLMEVFAERKEKEAKLNSKHEMFNVTYNWIIVICIVALFASFIWWGTKVHNDNKEASIRATAYAEFEAEREQAAAAEAQAKAEAEAAEKASEEYIVGKMTTALSKMYYGIKSFQDKYHYADEDFETYGRCAYNRMLNPSYSDDFAEVVFQEAQFLSCSESNPDVEPYHSMAKKHIQKWRSESVAPVTNDFVYAELTPNGVYLKNDFNADGYSRRWRAGT